MNNTFFHSVFDNDEALITLPPSAGGDIALTTDESAILAVSSGGSFLPRLQLCGSSTDLCKEGKINISHWAFITGKDNFEDLGKTFDCLVICGRVKAVDIKAKISSYDHNDPVFKSIQDQANGQNGKMFGPEFLCWLPDRGYATVHLSSVTARNEAAKIFARLQKACNFSSKLHDNGKNKWHGPIFKPSTVPFANMPAMEELIEKATSFKNPKTTVVELASQAGDGEAERER